MKYKPGDIIHSLHVGNGVIINNSKREYLVQWDSMINPSYERIEYIDNYVTFVTNVFREDFI